MRILSALLVLACRATRTTSASAQEAGLTLQYEVVIVHLRSDEPLPVAEEDLTAEACLAGIEQWRDDGLIESLTRVRLSSVENQMAQCQIGTQQLLLVGRTFSQRGDRFSTPSYSSEETGTLLAIMGRVQDDGRIVMEAQIEQSRLVPQRAAPASDAAKGEPDLNVDRPNIDTTTTTTPLPASDSQPQIAGAVWSESSDGAAASIIILTPSVISSDE